MLDLDRTLGRVRENSCNSAIVRTQITGTPIPRGEVGNDKRKLPVAGFDSPPKKNAAVRWERAAPNLPDKHRAAAPAPARGVQAHQSSIMVEGKVASSIASNRGHGCRSAVAKSSPIGLALKAKSASLPFLTKRRISSYFMVAGKSSSPVRRRAVSESAPLLQNGVLGRRKWEASRHLMKKAGSASSASTSRASLQGTMARTTSSSAHPRISPRPKPTFAFARQQIRGSSHIREEPRRPSVGRRAGCVLVDHRGKVQGRLDLFRELATKLQRDKEEKPDMKAFKILKESGMTPSSKYVGEVPGVEVGDEFCYRAELMVAGLHGVPIAGIDSMRLRGISVATCVVSSFNGYVNTMEGGDVLVYSGEGGNPCFESTRKGPAGDQRLVRGNLALKNSMDARTPVRVVHGFTVPRGGESLESAKKTAVKYVYDGLYRVEDFWWEKGREGFMVLKFRLRRMPGQPKLVLKQVRRLKGQQRDSAVAANGSSMWIAGTLEWIRNEDTSPC